MRRRMMHRRCSKGIVIVLLCGIFGAACSQGGSQVADVAEAGSHPGEEAAAANARPTIASYATVRLAPDLSRLSPRERQMLPLLILAAEQMNEMFWIEAYGDKTPLLDSIDDDETRRLVELNYGPWDRLGDNQPLIPGVGPKPLGAGFYPHDMTREEFETYIEEHPDEAEAFKSEYTVIRQDKSAGLIAIPYHVYFDRWVLRAVEVLRQASVYADDPAFRNYLRLRAIALLTDDYRESDFAWMEVGNSSVDLVIGPIEHYEDAMFGYKAAHEALVLIKDHEASARLSRFVHMLPTLQKTLPVPEEYKQEEPGLDSSLGVYDVVYCAGDANAAKAIGVNLPNDEQVQLQKGARRLQLRNVCRAKYDEILHPIADLMIVEDQRAHVQFDAFFQNVLFHEVAHGLGIKHTINGMGPVREALKDQFDVIEEAKADLLGLYIVGEMRRRGQIESGELTDNYVTYAADMARLMRWGATDAYGQMTMMAFGFMQEQGAIVRDSANGAYRIDTEKMRRAVEELCRRILILQGDGDYEGTKALIERYGVMNDALKRDLEKIEQAGVPIDLIFEQGPEVLGLPRAG